MPKPIAFVVMPFNVKPTGIRRPDVPSEVDFDALWERVYRPVLADLGYTPVRADRDIGALVIAQMIQRLTLADLVVADLALPNGNVGYEVGIRHAAKPDGCVLVAPDWADPIFDLNQSRRLTFPLRDGRVGDDVVVAAQAPLRQDLQRLAGGRSPVFDAVPGYPANPERKRLSAFEDDVAEFSEFQADVRAVRNAPRSQRRARATALLAKHGNRGAIRELVVLELLRLVRDYTDWKTTLEYIDGLPERLAKHPLILEQRALALAKSGDDVPKAAAALEALIEDHGATAERLGLLGGRHKQLLKAATDRRERRHHLEQAIGGYERGMKLDLNDFYCSGNLPRLYRRRGKTGDEQRAAATVSVAMIACHAAIERDPHNEWAWATLLGTAFDAGDVDEAGRLRDEIESRNTADWQLQSMFDDLQTSLEQQEDASVRSGLRAVVDDLEPLLPDREG